MYPITLEELIRQTLDAVENQRKVKTDDVEVEFNLCVGSSSEDEKKLVVHLHGGEQSEVSRIKFKLKI